LDGKSKRKVERKGAANESEESGAAAPAASVKAANGCVTFREAGDANDEPCERFLSKLVCRKSR
jgi:hypothetical protein